MPGDGKAVRCQELDRIAPRAPRRSRLAIAFAPVHLPQVRRELRLLVSSARDVFVGGDDLPRWLQVSRGRTFRGRARLLEPLFPRLFIEAYPHRSILTFSSSSDCGVDTAASSRPIESSARYTSLLEKLSRCAHLLWWPRNSPTRPRAAGPRNWRKSSFQVSHFRSSSPAKSHSRPGLLPNTRSSA